MLGRLRCRAPPARVSGRPVVMEEEEVLAEELDDEEKLVRRHRKEKKELQAKIQGMKNAVPKNDKKRRKQLTEDVAKLEREMEQKHREELEQLKLTFKDSKILLLLTFQTWYLRINHLGFQKHKRDGKRRLHWKRSGKKG